MSDIHTNRLVRLLLIACVLGTSTAMPLKLDRVILSTNDDPRYIQFWPMVAKAWKEIVGVQPTLALIGDESVQVDESLGDVIRFEPIEGLPDGQYAQAVRLLLPALFEDETCIVSDIDMVPLTKKYFTESIQDVPEENFAVYRDGIRMPARGYDGEDGYRYVMCYTAAKGSVFKEVFNVNNVEDIPAMIKHWYSFGWERDTDERFLFKALHEWPAFSARCSRLGHVVNRRITRIIRTPDRGLRFRYDRKLLKEGYYIDAHMPRPYKKYKAMIDEMMAHLGTRVGD